MSPLLGKFRNLHPGVGIEAVIGVGGEFAIQQNFSARLKVYSNYLINLKSLSITTRDILLYGKL